MGMGTYACATPREIFGDCDYELKAKSKFPGSQVGEAFSMLRDPTIWSPSYATVTHRQVEVLEDTLPKGQVKLLTREVTLH